ncbi:MAG: hypothetical protein PARBB_01586 [Parabacteroides distasonis]
MVIINKKTNGTHPIAQWNTNKIPLSYRMDSIGL